MGLLSGLGKIGLGSLENMDIFADEEKEKQKERSKEAPATPEGPKEEELLYDKMYDCPVCGLNFPSKTVKSGKTKLIGTDADLRARYDNIDPGKYDVVLCPKCGYAALTRFYDKLSQAQAKLIKEKISPVVTVPEYDDPIYTYPEAVERYKLALASAVVKRAKASEKAYICLKSGWLMRGYREKLQAEGKADPRMAAELEKQENEYLQNAYKGFVEAVQTEAFPMCGMDEMTVNYLMAVLAVRFKKFDVAGRLIATVLGSTSANPRMKDRARDLKEQVLAELKKSR